MNTITWVIEWMTASTTEINGHTEVVLTAGWRCNGTDGIVKNATCDFDPTSTVTLTERILQPEYFQVNLQLCKSDFRSDWDAIQMLDHRSISSSLSASMCATRSCCSMSARAVSRESRLSSCRQVSHTLTKLLNL